MKDLKRVVWQNIKRESMLEIGIEEAIIEISKERIKRMANRWGRKL